MESVNYGVLTEEESHKLDCSSYDITDKTQHLDPPPAYQITTNDKGETILKGENGFLDFMEHAELIA